MALYVTKTYLPPQEEYQAYLDKIWQRSILTNNGPLVQELERQLRDYLGVKHVLFCNNGTIAIQIAMKAMGVQGEVITTPFSYCATTTALLWENCTPIFVDIEPKSLNIDASKIEAAITPKTTAILATHVYGLPCEVNKIEAIAQKHQLKVIYDAAHAFGVQLNGKSLFEYGDIATCSFHATKLFHTIEGGAIITNNDEYAHLCDLYRSFGHKLDNYFVAGINGKASEFNAAMGLCVLPKVSDLIQRRKEISEIYDQKLAGKISRPFSEEPDIEYNFAYYPVLFKNEAELLTVKKALEAEQIFSRRYFYPTLNQLPYLENQQSCPVSEDVALRVLALPLFYDLEMVDIERICRIVVQNVHCLS